MNIFLEATYGINNFGDDLLLKLFNSYLEEIGANCVIAGRIDNYVIGDGPIITVGRLNLIKKLKIINHCDAILIGGGGQFNDNNSRTGGAHLALTILICLLYNKPVVVCGTGFGPLKRKLSRTIWKFLGSHRNVYFAIREISGVHLLKELTGQNAILCSDPIFSKYSQKLFSIEHLRKKRESSSVSSLDSGMINFRRFRRSKFVEMAIVEALNEYKNREPELDGINYLRGLSVDNKGDLAIEELSAYDIKIFESYTSINATINLISNSRFVVTQRFHVLCACILIGVPVIPVCYADKMIDFCEWMGLPYITTEDVDQKEISKIVYAALSIGPIDLSLLNSRADVFQWLESILQKYSLDI